MSFSYLLDANTYIQAKNFHYRMHIVPGFWDWLDMHLHSGAVGSIRPVRDELEAGKDQLSDWVKERRDVFLPVDDEPTQTAFADIANYVMTHDVFAEPHTTHVSGRCGPMADSKGNSLRRRGHYAGNQGCGEQQEGEGPQPLRGLPRPLSQHI